MPSRPCSSSWWILADGFLMCGAESNSHAMLSQAGSKTDRLVLILFNISSGSVFVFTPKNTQGHFKRFLEILVCALHYHSRTHFLFVTKDSFAVFRAESCSQACAETGGHSQACTDCHSQAGAETGGDPQAGTETGRHP